MTDSLPLKITVVEVPAFETNVVNQAAFLVCSGVHRLPSRRVPSPNLPNGKVIFRFEGGPRALELSELFSLGDPTVHVRAYLGAIRDLRDEIFQK